MAATDQTSAPPGGLIGALRWVLRPLVRLLLAQQIPFPQVSELVKGLYVEVAERDFPLEGRRQTDSRISLLTGVHRKDVKRLRAEPHAGAAAPRAVSLGAQIAARWSADHVDGEGRPRPLPVASANGDEGSFDTLVRSVSRDIRPRSVLDEWLRLGVAHFDDRGRVVLDAGAFVPQQGFEEKLWYFGRNLHDHVAAATHNVLGEDPPFLERSVHYGSLCAPSTEELAELAEREGMRVLRDVNRRAQTLQQRDVESAGERRRIRFGIYFYDAPDEAIGGSDGSEDDA